MKDQVWSENSLSLYDLFYISDLGILGHSKSGYFLNNLSVPVGLCSSICTSF
jgi:hypothetical protein